MLEEMMNNMLDYYRGSGLYEVAVQNQLNYFDGNETKQAINQLEESISENTDVANGIRRDIKASAFAMYNMGQGIRDDIQNMEMGIRNDIRVSALMNTNAIQEMAIGIRSDIRESTYAVVASQEILAKSFQHGFNAVNNTLELGFNLLGKKFDVLSDNICSKLDQIHDILNNPRLTESRELYRQALSSFNKGYFEDALKDCKEAVEKNSTDYISWYLLGLIYLFGAGKFDNVINLEKAEEAFYKAAKYIDYDIGHSEEANTLASRIYYYLGQARLAISNDCLVKKLVDDSISILVKAEKSSATAYQLSKDNLLAGYEQAKELHFLEKNDESLKLLEELIRAEKNFALKAINDKNFQSLWGKIEHLILNLRDEVSKEITRKCDEVRELYDIEKRRTKLLNIDFPCENKINDFESFFHNDFIKEEYRELMRAVCDDFNRFAMNGETFHSSLSFVDNQPEESDTSNRYVSQQSQIYYDYQDIFKGDNIIKNIRQGKSYLISELDRASRLIEEVLAPFESSIKKDYFYVLQKNKEFGNASNQEKLRILSKNMKDLFYYYDRNFIELDRDVKSIFCYLDKINGWEQRKVSLRDEYAGVLEKKCEDIRLSWTSRIEALKKKLLEIHFPSMAEINSFELFYYKKIKNNPDRKKSFDLILKEKGNSSLINCDKVIENLRNGKKFVSEELDTVCFRIDEVFKQFESNRDENYFVMLKKYSKFIEARLCSPDSYFEYSLSLLQKEIEALEADAMEMYAYINTMRN